MMDFIEVFLGNIYCLFEFLFGEYLAEHLWGYNCETQDYDSKIPFNSVGLTSIFVVLSSVLIFYYIINHPRFNRSWSWLIALGVTCVINWGIGFWWTYSDFQNGLIGDCLMYERNSDGAIISDLITKSDCVWFGFANAAFSVLFFSLFSLIIKWWSRNSKNSPF